MDLELIDSNISVIASALEMEIPEKEIIDAYVTAEFQQYEIFLLLTAAKIIYNDRKTAIKPKGIFRRSE